MGEGWAVGPAWGGGLRLRGSAFRGGSAIRGEGGSHAAPSGRRLPSGSGPSRTVPRASPLPASLVPTRTRALPRSAPPAAPARLAPAFHSPSAFHCTLTSAQTAQEGARACHVRWLRQVESRICFPDNSSPEPRCGSRTHLRLYLRAPTPVSAACHLRRHVPRKSTLTAILGLDGGGIPRSRRPRFTDLVPAESTLWGQPR